MKKYRLLLFFLILVGSLSAEITKQRSIDFSKIRDTELSNSRDEILRITNVSYYPNPFSPDNDGEKEESTISLYSTVAGDLDITLTSGVWIYTHSTSVIAGWNQWIWDGKNDSGVLGPEGTYQVDMTLDDGVTVDTYNQLAGLIMDMTAPTIQLISTAPNPFSPNADGYNDILRVRFEAEGVRTTYVGLIDVNVHPDSLSALFVADPENGGMIGPDNVAMSQYSEGSYLFLRRRSSTMDSDAKYKLTLNGIEEEITLGRSIYKLGYYSSPQFSVSEFIGMEYDEDNEEDEDEVYSGHDFFELYAIEGNATLNIYQNDGSVYNLNSLYDIYYGDDLLPYQNINYQMSVNIGNSGESDPNIYLNEEIPDGRYIYRVIITDDVGHEVEESGEFIVDNNPITVEGSLEPTRISPENSDGILDVAVVHYSVSEDAFVTIKIWDEDDQIVKIIKQSEFMEAGSGFVLWDGKNEAGDFVAQNSEESFEIEITAQDKFVLEEVVSVRPELVVDNKIPTASDLFQPEPDSLTANELTVSGLTDEIQSNIILFQNGVNKGIVGQTPEYPGYFTFPVVLEERLNDIYVRLEDNTGNFGVPSDTVSVILDSQAPIIVPVTPYQDSTFTQSPILLSALVSDAGVGVERVRFGLSIDGNESLEYIDATNSGNGLFEANYNISPNITNIDVNMLVVATDILGNESITSDPVHFAYAEPSATLPPVILTTLPSADSNIFDVEDDEIAIFVSSVSGISSDIDDTFIQLVHPSGSIIEAGSGASLAFYENATGEYKIALTLSNSLNDIGYDDGEYDVVYRIENAFEQEITGNYTFNYDTTVPEIEDIKINVTEDFTILNDVNLFNQTINEINIELSDNVSGIDWAPNVTNFVLQNPDDDLVPTTRSIAGNILTLTLLNPILTNNTSDGDYKISGLCSDKSGNTFNDIINFRLQSNTDVTFISSFPENSTYINTIAGNLVSFNILDESGYGLDEDSILFTMIGAGTTYSEANGNAAVSVETLEDNEHKVILNLLETPAIDGATDGLYQLILSVSNNLGSNLTENTIFYYDRISPNITQMDVEDATHQSVLSGNDVVQHSIEEINFTVSDLLSDVDYNSSETIVKLYEYQGGLIPGNKVVFGNVVTWALLDPLSDDGSDDGVYEIRSTIKDIAGNTREELIVFTLDNPNPPSIVSIVPSDESYVSSINNNRIDLVIQDAQGIDTQNSGDNYLTVTTPDNVTISDDSGADLVLTPLGNFNYQFTLLFNEIQEEQGEYRVDLHSKNIYGDEYSDVFTFVIDSEAPIVNSIKFNNGNSDFNLSDEAVIYQNINEFLFEYTDSGSGIETNLTSITILKDGSSLSYSIVENTENSYNISLDTAIPNDGTGDGNYEISYEFIDNLGNQTSENITFELRSSNFVVEERLPAEDFGFVNSSFQEVSITIEDQSGVGFDETSINMILIDTNSGDVISDGNGGNVSMSTSGSSYTFTMELINSFLQNGEDDGIYQVDLNIETSGGEALTFSNQFTYDTITPNIVKIKANQVEIQDDAFLVDPELTEIEVDFDDITSGLNFAINATNIYLLDTDGVEISGVRQVDNNDNSISLSFVQNPVTSDLTPGDYTIRVRVTDFAGNTELVDLPFKFLSDDTTQYLSGVPVDGAVLRNLEDNKVEVRIKDYLGLLQSPQFTYVSISKQNQVWKHGLDASQTIELDGYEYLITLNLDETVPDGHYQLNVHTQNLSGRILENSTDFTLDSTPPEVLVTNMIYDNGESVELIDGRKITGNVTSIMVTIDDFVGVDNSTINCQVFDSDYQVVSNAPIISGNQIICNMIQPLTDAGIYHLGFYAEDELGQGVNISRDFQRVYFQYDLVEMTPEDQTMVTDALNNVHVKIADLHGIGVNTEQTNIVLSQVFEQTNQIYDGNGANLEISQSNDEYDISLNLDQPLAIDGSDDGQYHIALTIVSSDNISETLDFYFMYDHQAPEILQVYANQIPIQIGDIVREDITLVAAEFADDFTVDYAPNLTRTVLKRNGVVLNGVRQYIAPNKVQWLLDTSLSAYDDSGEYIVEVTAYDEAGNITNLDHNFELQPDIEINVLSASPVDGQTLNTVTNQEIAVVIQDLNRVGITSEDFRVVLNHNDVSYFAGNGATEIYEDLGNDQYRFGLTLDENLTINGQYFMKLYQRPNQLAGEWEFQFDTILPEIIGTYYWNDGVRLSLDSGESIITNIDSIEINVVDANLDLINSASSVQVQLIGGADVSGSTLFREETIIWTPDNTMTPDVNSGLYNFNIVVNDKADNRLVENRNFSIRQEGFPEFVSSVPENQAKVKYVSVIEGIVHDLSGLSVEVSDHNFLKLFGPDEAIYEHENGGQLTITDLGLGDYLYRLVLSNPLPEDGSKDGVYSIQVSAVNNDDNQIIQTTFFTLDTTSPEITNLTIGNNLNLLDLFDGMNIYQNVNQIRLTVSDDLTPIGWNETSIQVFDPANQEISGTSEVIADQGIFIYNLDNPIANDNQTYKVVVTVSDEVQNIAITQYLFTMSVFEGEFVGFSPIQGELINEDLSEFSAQVDYEGTGINWNHSYVIVRNTTQNQLFGDPRFTDDDWGTGSGGQVTIEGDIPDFTVKLNLVNPLSDNGGNDGLYEMKVVLLDYDNQTTEYTLNFVYDRTNPVVSNLVFNTSRRSLGDFYDSTTRKNRNRVFSAPIQSVSVDFSDETSGLEEGTHSTFITLINENEQVLPGVISVQGNTYTWTLNEALNTDGTYKVIMQGSDLAGNTAIYEAEFQFVSQPNLYPRIKEWRPESIPGYVNASINSPVFEVEYYDHFGLVESNVYSSMYIKFPDGQFSFSGGDIEYTSSDTTYTMTYTLDGDFDENGANDGTYMLYSVATNLQGYSVTDSLQFIYDSVSPIILNTMVTDTNNTTSEVVDNSEVNNGITKVSVAYDDETAGLYYVPNLTNISLVDENFVPVDGDMEYVQTSKIGSVVEWTLNSPLANDGSDDGLYYLELQATDRSGNGIFYRRPIVLFSPLEPTNFTAVLDAVDQVHLTWTPYVPTIADPQAKKNKTRDLNYFEIFRKVDNGDFTKIAETEVPYYLDIMHYLDDGIYQYALRAVYSAGISDLVESHSISLERFRNVTLIAKNGESPLPDVLITMVGNDGIYNKEYEVVTNNTGSSVLSDVYFTDYIVTFAKEGFVTLVDTIKVTETNEDFEFAMMSESSSFGVNPEATVLNQNSPNPFNPTTNINFALKDDSKVELEIYNVKGQRIVSLLNKRMLPGNYSMPWHGVDAYGNKVSSGVYFYRLRYKSESENKVLTRKMIMLK